MTQINGNDLNHPNNKVLNIFSEVEKLMTEVISKEARSCSVKKFRKTVFDQFDGGISITGFIEEVLEEFGIEGSTLIFSVALIIKLSKKVCITNTNVFIIIYIALIVSSKMQQDSHLNEEDLGHFIGVSRSQLSVLEFHFLEILSYNVFVNEIVFQQYRKLICGSL